MMVVPAGSLGTVEEMSLEPVSMGVEIGFGEVVGVLITDGDGEGSDLLAVTMVVVVEEGLVVTEGRVTVITEISPLP